MKIPRLLLASFYVPMILIPYGLLANAQQGSDDKIDVKALLERTDDLYRSQSSIATILMTIKTPHWTRELEMQAWSQGREKTLIRILKPRKERGIATLKLDQNMWNYFPKINQVIKVPASMMMGSWMGSDLTNDDLVKEYRYSEDFNYEFTQKKQRYLITIKPKAETISVWGKIELYLDANTEIPLEEYYYNEKGEAIRHMTFSDTRKIGDRAIPFQMTLENLSKKGHQTIVRYQSLELDATIEANTFSRQNLQKRI